MSLPHIHGKIAENQCRNYFLERGFTLMEHRFQPPKIWLHAGEIDFIFKKHTLYIFVEVKYTPHFTHDLISLKQKKQYVYTALYYPSLAPHAQNIQFDAFFYSSHGNFQHIPNAWSADILSF